MTVDRDPRPPARRVARNTALRAAAELLGKVASVVLFAYIARELGQSSLGDFVFSLALVQIVWAVAGFGLDRMALRDVAREREAAVHRLFWDVNGFKLVLGVAGVGLAVGGVALAGYSSRVQLLVLILGLALVLVLLSSTAQAVFQAYERMEYFLYVSVPNKVLAALLGIAVLIAGGGLVGVALGQLVAAAAGVALALVILRRRFIWPRPRIRPRRWRGLARAGAPFGLQEVLGQLLFRIDIVLLSVLTTSAIVGEYGAAYRVLEATLFLSWSVGTSVLPMYSYLGRGDTPSLDVVFSNSVKFLLVILLPVGVLTLVCARPIVDLLYGLPAYEGTVDVLRWLAMATVAYGVGHLAGILVLVRRPGRLIVGTMAIAVAAKAALAVALIPAFEAEGAAVATLAAELLLAGLSLYLARAVAGTPRLRGLLGPVAAAAAMGAAMLPFADRLELALPLGVLVYAAVLLAIEARTIGGDFATVKEAFAPRRPAPVASESEPLLP